MVIRVWLDVDAPSSSTRCSPRREGRASPSSEVELPLSPDSLSVSADPRSPRYPLMRHTLSRDFFNRRDYLLHGSSGSRPNVDGKAILARCQMVERLQMCAGQIIYVDVIANASSIRGGIVGSKHLQLGTKSSG